MLVENFNSLNIIEILDINNVEKVVIDPGELNIESEYRFPNIIERFLKHNQVKRTSH